MIQKIKQWLIQRSFKKKSKKEAIKRRKEIQVLSKNMQELYSFVKWLNKTLPNRKAKKAFWIKIKDGEPLIEKEIKFLLEKLKNNTEKITKFINEV